MIRIGAVQKPKKNVKNTIPRVLSQSKLKLKELRGQCRGANAQWRCGIHKHKSVKYGAQ